MVTDKRDQRDPTLLGQQILQRPDKMLPASKFADQVLTVSKNGTGKS
jgi:hypothetical protein